MATGNLTPARYLEALERALLAPNTRKGYAADWEFFARWAAAQKLPAFPCTAETLALFVATRLSGRKVSTVTRNIAAVGHMHREAGFDSPVTQRVRDLLRGARRLKHERVRQVRPLSIENVRAIAELLMNEDTPLAMRNRALIIVGFASGLRAANLAALLLSDVEFTNRGVELHIRSSKTDQEGRGQLIGLPPGEHTSTCPVSALRAWIERRGAFPGPLYTRFDCRGTKEKAIQPERIGQVVQEVVAKIGLDPQAYCSHSMRSGFVTAAGESGCSELSIAATTGHRDMATLRRYFRHTDIWRSNPSGKIGL